MLPVIVPGDRDYGSFNDLPSLLTFRNPMKNGFTNDHRYTIVEARNVGNMV